MDIQRGNVQLYRKLKNLETSPLRTKVEEVLGVDFFKNIDDLVK
jgi:hypothetical protein